MEQIGCVRESNSDAGGVQGIEHPTPNIQHGALPVAMPAAGPEFAAIDSAGSPGDTGEGPSAGGS